MRGSAVQIVTGKISKERHPSSPTIRGASRPSGGSVRCTVPAARGARRPCDLRHYDAVAGIVPANFCCIATVEVASCTALSRLVDKCPVTDIGADRVSYTEVRRSIRPTARTTLERGAAKAQMPRTRLARRVRTRAGCHDQCDDTQDRRSPRPSLPKSLANRLSRSIGSFVSAADRTHYSTWPEQRRTDIRSPQPGPARQGSPTVRLSREQSRPSQLPVVRSLQSATR
jgi:hypothetical protein